MRVHRFSEEEFNSLTDQWQELLFRSNADRLFLSWHWMHSWWTTYADDSKDSLLLVGVYDDDNTLLCLAPLYQSKERLKQVLPFTRTQFLGTKASGSAGFRTEYLEFITDRQAPDQCIDLILAYLTRHSNSGELLLNDLVIDSATYRQLVALNVKKGFYQRPQERDQAYGIDTKGTFNNYIASLGKNSRLKTYNRRTLLNTLGDVVLEPVTADNYPDVLTMLTDFHRSRWEQEISYKSHQQFLAQLTESGDIRISGIIIRLDGNVIGCTFDLISDNRSYNFQIGYSDDVSKKISMGSLTLGYAIELYYDDVPIKYYDFMAGEGKNSNYKSRIAEPGKELCRLQTLVSPVLAMVYKVKDKLDAANNKGNSQLL